jgi:hypothetical protein
VQDRPTAAELLSVTAAFLRTEVLPALDGRVAFHVRVAANVLDIVEREWRLGPEHDRLDRAALGALVGESESMESMVDALAARVRAGDLDDRDDVLRFLIETTERRLAIANPRHLRERPWDDGD